MLSNQSSREQDSWKDYRLELFEEIIKEGRKFSFFITLSSQRPADISSTILSQVHNFFLHKLVNERDLQIIDNSISTMDKISKSMLPVLAQGVCIISGTAVSMPITVNIDFIENEKIRPQSDTINLANIWRQASKE
ncbi:ATP-binding protein [Listeria innocua]|nr:ATP-binding protein [Listeria innocua]